MSDSRQNVDARKPHALASAATDRGRNLGHYFDASRWLRFLFFSSETLIMSGSLGPLGISSQVPRTAASIDTARRGWP